MRRTSARKPAVTGATSMADDEVWLRLYEKGIEGGRSEGEATAHADAGTSAFKRRFAKVSAEGGTLSRAVVASVKADLPKEPK